MCWPIGWGAEASMTDLFADVLVIGGGPAGTWAALSAIFP
jgi:glycerol-3-phosphate dehydrogenase